MGRERPTIRDPIRGNGVLRAGWFNRRCHDDMRHGSPGSGHARGGVSARARRVYLPLDGLREVGLDPDAWLASPEPVDGIRTVVRGLLDDADDLYSTAWIGIERLPTRCRPAIRAAALVYAEIGQKIRAAGYDSVTARAWTRKVEKARLLARGFRNRPGAWERSRSSDRESNSVERADRSAAFIVDAASGS